MWSNASVILWNFFLSSVELNVVLTLVTCNSHLQHTSTELTNSHNRRNIFVAIEAVDVMACIWLEEDRRLKLTLHISSLSFSSDMIIVLIGTRQDALCHHVVSKIVIWHMTRKKWTCYHQAMSRSLLTRHQKLCQFSKRFL